MKNPFETEERRAFRETVDDLISMYKIRWEDVIVAHDLHPQYRSTAHASALPAAETRAIQHHRAHIASALAERAAWEKRVLGVSLDGTGYGDDGSIWGGEIFAGSVSKGFGRVAHEARSRRDDVGIGQDTDGHGRLPRPEARDVLQAIADPDSCGQRALRRRLDHRPVGHRVGEGDPDLDHVGAGGRAASAHHDPGRRRQCAHRPGGRA